MIRFFKSIYPWYAVLKDCWVVLFIHLVGVYAFIGFEQGLDMMKSLSFINSQAFGHTLIVCISLVWWSWQSWRSAKILIYASELDELIYKSLDDIITPENVSYATRLIHGVKVKLPYILATIPFILVAVGVAIAKDDIFNHLSVLILCIGTLTLLLMGLYARSNMAAIDIMVLPPLGALIIKGTRIFFPDFTPLDNQRNQIAYIWKEYRVAIILKIALLVLPFITFSIYPVIFGELIGATAIVILGFGVWLSLITIAHFVEKSIRFPIIISLFILSTLFSFFNNNDTIRTIAGSAIKVNNREKLSNHFNQWLDKRISELADSSDELPIFIVAAEGGGIRSAYWTTLVLTTLSDKYPRFSKNVYAISSVSGGSLGAGVYAALLKAKNGYGQTLEEQGKEIINNDFLSPLTSYLVFPDLLQRFLPFPIDRWDRAKVLEYSWEKAWLKTMGTKKSNFINDGFLDLWDNDGDMKIPSLFLNGTHVESGKRTVVSNSKLDSNFLFQISDVLDTIGVDVPLSTAMLLSARFPVVTPSAKIMDAKGNYWGNIVDGGYFENSGVATALEIYEEIKYILNLRKHDSLNVKIYIVSIQNSKEVVSKPSMSPFYEFSNPINTFLNVWDNRTDYSLNRVVLNTIRNGDKLVEIKLERTDSIDMIPLGWVLSKPAARAIDNQEGRVLQIMKPILENAK